MIFQHSVMKLPIKDLLLVLLSSHHHLSFQSKVTRVQNDVLKVVEVGVTANPSKLTH